jgi:hypothetical protein
MFGRLPIVARRRRNRDLLRTAFAGDGIEKAFVQAAVRVLKIRHMVETGTHSGKTSLWLGSTFRSCDVFTCEVVPEVYEMAKRTLAQQKNVRVDLADSGTWVHALCESEIRGHSALFFLDAHGMASVWNRDHPLLAELRSIENRDQPSIIIIDDFKVPDRPDMAFCVRETHTSMSHPLAERMDLGDALDISLISDAISDSDVLLFPDYTYEDALRFQANPAFQNLVGYVIILHACSGEELDALLADPVVRDYYRTVW